MCSQGTIGPLILLLMLTTGCQRTIELGLPDSRSETASSEETDSTDVDSETDSITDTTTSSETTTADTTD